MAATTPTEEMEESVIDWSVDQVAAFLQSKGIPEAYIHTIAGIINIAVILTLLCLIFYVHLIDYAYLFYS